MRTRMFVVLAVAALSLWAVYPPRDAIKLGLDLNGGVQLVLRVDTDDGLRQRTTAAAETVRQALDRARVAFDAVEPVDSVTFRVTGITDPNAFLRIADETARAHPCVSQRRRARSARDRRRRDARW